MFEALYQYDHLAAPAKVIPNTAAAMPEITDGGRTWTIRLERGVRFAPQRNALVRTMSGLAQTYAPMIFQVDPVTNVFVHRHVRGYDPSPFGFSWKYLDVEAPRRDGRANAR